MTRPDGRPPRCGRHNRPRPRRSSMAYPELSDDCRTRLAEGFYTSAVPAAGDWPLRTFLPTGYEPNYPYPLLVFLHGHGSSEEQVLRFAPRLSRRNYICIALRGPHRLEDRPGGGPAYSWGPDGPHDASLEDYILRAVEQTR